MINSSRLYNVVSLLMITLSASVCIVVTLIVLSALSGGGGWVAAAPTLIGYPTATPTLPGPTPPVAWTAGPRPTRTPHPTWTPAPTDTPSPLNTPEAIAPHVSLSGNAPDDPPLDLITTIPNPKDVPEVALQVDLHYADQWALVEQAVHVRNNTDAVWDEVVFSIPLAAYPDAFALDSASSGSPAKTVTARLDGIMLHVPLDRSVSPGLLARINLRYRVGISGVSIYSSFPEGNNGFSGDVLRMGEWYPVIAPYRPRQGWQTWTYRPIGDPTVYPAANTTLAVKAPPGVTVVSGGSYGKEGDVWRFRVAGARAMPIFASDKYEVVEGTVSNMPVRCFTLGENEDAANTAIDVSRDVIALYTSLYGSYPFKSLDIVENGYYGDMEYSALVSISSRSFKFGENETPYLLHTLLAHELAHQWWYGGVGNDQVNEPWLDEALASYSEVLYYERQLKFKPNPRMDTFRSRELGTTIDLSIYDYPTGNQYREALYPRGAVFMDELRRAVGDDAFFAFLKDYSNRYRGKLATTQDFFDTLRRHTTADLTPLLDAFFADPNR